MDLRYPIGNFEEPVENTAAMQDEWIAVLDAAPERFRAAVKGLSDSQLDTPYRPGGWTVRQVVHHVADSHMNAYVRFRLALTEDEPTIKPYDEAKWADLPDAATMAPQVSLELIDGLHRRWVTLLRSLRPVDFARRFRHPELGVRDLGRTLALYAWHSRHHEAHITALREREGW